MIRILIADDHAIVREGYGCHIAQGYLYSRPIPASAFDALPLSFPYPYPFEVFPDAEIRRS